MSLDTAIGGILAAGSGLTTLVGSRIYRDKLVQNPTYPAITYSLISSVPEHAMGADAGLEMSRVQVSCWATTAGVVESVADAVRTATSRQRGTFSGVVVQDIFVENEGPTFFEPELEVWQRPVDLMIARER